MELQKPAPFISADQIAVRVRELGEKITADYPNQKITVICILKGSVIFFSDLIRMIDRPIECEFMCLSSYGNQMQSSGEVKVTLDLKNPIEGKHVLVVEDIVDSGLTLHYTLNQLRLRRPASLRCASLLYKPQAVKPEIKSELVIDYVGFEIPSRFVVGYGLDYAENYRGLPFVGTLDNVEE